MKTGLGQKIRFLRGEERRVALEELMERFRRSGKTATAFSKEIGTTATTFGRWRAEVRRSLKSEAGPTFVELGKESAGTFEVVLASGIRVAIPSGFRANELRRLLQVLAS